LVFVHTRDPLVSATLAPEAISLCITAGAGAGAGTGVGVVTTAAGSGCFTGASTTRRGGVRTIGSGARFRRAGSR
jgi:hypothetical protein